jgi:4-oxalomesaconate hydratase
MQPTVLYIGAHDVDFLVRAGGTLARYVRDGSRVVAASLTLGERQESERLWKERPDISLSAAIEIRMDESTRCAELLGCEFRWLGWEDCPLVLDRSRMLAIVSLIQEIKPDILITHSPEERTNPDHRTTGDAVRDAVLHAASAGSRIDTRRDSWPAPALYFSEPWFPFPDFNHFEPNVWIDITATYDTKLEGLKAAWSHGRLDLTYPLAAEFRGMQARLQAGDDNIRFAEAFLTNMPWVGTRLPFERCMPRRG